jgi:hypothetical protein
MRWHSESTTKHRRLLYEGLIQFVNNYSIEAAAP